MENNCQHKKSACTDSRLTTARPFKDFKGFIGVVPECIRRRRKCVDCGEMFTTYEIRKEDLDLLVNQAHDSKRGNYELIKGFIEWARSLPDEVIDKRL